MDIWMYVHAEWARQWVRAGESFRDISSKCLANIKNNIIITAMERQRKNWFKFPCCTEILPILNETNWGIPGFYIEKKNVGFERTVFVVWKSEQEWKQKQR